MDKSTADDILARTREGYRTAGRTLASSREKLYGREIERFVDYVREGEKVLDVGCGDGQTYERLRAKKARYAGVDLSEELIAAAREKWKGTDAEFAVGDLMGLPVEDGAFDAALAVAVLHHIPSREYRVRALRELARAVRKGGYVFITSWNLWQPKYWHALVHQRLGRRNGWDRGDLLISWRKPLFPRFYHVFTMKEMRELCAEAGLEIVEHYYVRKGEITNWLRGENLVTIARKP